MDTHAQRSLRNIRLATCMIGAVLCVTSLGCLSLSFGNWTSHNGADDPTILKQSGSARVSKGEIAEIYYPVPYATAPNVELDDMFHNYEVVEQKADHFRVRNKSGTFDVKWTARGVRNAPPAVVVQPAITTTSTTTP